MNKKVFYLLSACLLALIIALSLFLVSELSKKSNILPPIKKEFVTENACPSQPGAVNITLITDSRYTPPTMVVMSSAIKNKCPASIYNFYIIAENITPADKNALQNLKNLAPETVNINIIEKKEPNLPYENMQRFLQYKVGMHKIYLPDTLQNLDKVIYMDGDTLVQKDLRQLFETDVSNVYAAVAKDGIYYRFPKEMAEMGLDKRGFYFNSGVMLLNLKLQRQDNIVKKLEEYIAAHTDFYGDQDVLNVVFGDKLKLMSYRYNCISTFFEADGLDFLSGYFGEKLPQNTTDIYKNAAIIHYAGDKPWQEDYKPPFLKELWFKYYNEIKDY